MPDPLTGFEVVTSEALKVKLSGFTVWFLSCQEPEPDCEKWPDISPAGTGYSGYLVDI